MHTMKYANIILHSSGQLWSNVSLRTQSAGLRAMLVKPSFLDLVQLSLIHSPSLVLDVATELRNAGEISQQRFDITSSMLTNIEEGIREH